MSPGSDVGLASVDPYNFAQSIRCVGGIVAVLVVLVVLVVRMLLLMLLLMFCWCVGCRCVFDHQTRELECKSRVCGQEDAPFGLFCK